MPGLKGAGDANKHQEQEILSCFVISRKPSRESKHIIIVVFVLTVSLLDILVHTFRFIKVWST